MTSLYQLSGDYLSLQNKLNDSDIDPQTIADTLEGAAGELEEKAINLSYVIRNMESHADQIKLAEDAMASRRKAIETKVESLRRYLKDNMQRTGITKIECPHFAIQLKTNPPAVVIENEDVINDKFKVSKTTVSIDKKAIKSAIDAGEIVEGAKLESGQRVEIK
jgi:hypothetical protein